jgi:two-component system cell cycle response regulator
MSSKRIQSRFGPQRILVVEDEDYLRDMLFEALTRLGHQVRVAGNGLEALERLAEATVEVVITDLHMPAMDGLELIREVRRLYPAVDIITITGYSSRYPYTDVIAAGAADFITKPFTLDKLEAKLVRLFRERSLRLSLEEMAQRDPLTGLFNRRHFETVITDEAVRSIRYQHPLSLIFMDVDRFKQYNDNHGHRAGDTLLAVLAETILASIREHVDKAFRYGGDEFLVVLPVLDLAGARNVAERIRQNYGQKCSRETSLSIGIAQLRVESGDLEKDIEKMIRRADESLYYVKKQFGGDRVSCADGEAIRDSSA